MSRRAPVFPLLFLAIWALWFALPITREAAIHQWHLRFFPAPPPKSPVSSITSPRDEVLVEYVYKQDGLVARLPLQPLQRLETRFPGDATICAVHILTLFKELPIYGTRQPGPSMSGSGWSVKRIALHRIPSDTLNSWFALAARGARLEPDNSFWDWVRIIGLLAARRDAEVWPVLRAASTKNLYEDHLSDVGVARLRVLQMQSGGSVPPMTHPSLSPLQRLILNLTAQSHFTTLEEAVGQINDNAVGLRLTGKPENQKLALQGMSDCVKLARTARRNAKTSNDFFVGFQLETIGLYGGTVLPHATVTNGTTKISLAAYANDPKSLLFFARKMGRNDIASWLTSDWGERAAWTRLGSTPFRLYTSTGLDVRDIALAQAGDWLGTLLLAGLPSLLVVAILSSLALRRFPLWRHTTESYPSSLSWKVGGLLAVVSVLVLSSSALWEIGQGLSRGDTGLDLLENLSIFDTPFGVVGIPPFWLSHFPAILAVLFALSVAAHRESRRQGVLPLTTRLRRMGIPPEDGLTRFDFSPLLTLLASLFGSLFCIAAMLAFLVLPGQMPKLDFFHSPRYAIPVLIIAVLCLAMPFVWRLRTATSWAFALATVRRFAWSQLISLSFLWGILWLLAAPAQRRFDTALTHQIQMGEFQLVRQQLGL